MEHAVRVGKIRSLGMCNIYDETIDELLEWAKEPVSVIQNWFDPLSQDLETREICAKNNIRFMGYSTLGKILACYLDNKDHNNIFTLHCMNWVLY